MSETASVQASAEHAYKWFDTATRTNGVEFVRVKECAPEWITELCLTAHGDMFPDDLRYEMIRSALAWISDSDDLEDAGHEFADAEVDVYTSARTAWLASHLDRVGYVQEAIAEFGAAEGSDVVEMIGWGWYAEAREVFELVAQFLSDRIEA